MSEKEKCLRMPWERLAMIGEEMPDGLPLPEQMLFVILRGLHFQYRKGAIGIETAKREKMAAIREYELAKVGYESGERWTRLIKETETARTAYRKNRTLENADKLIIVIDGVLAIKEND